MRKGLVITFAVLFCICLHHSTVAAIITNPFSLAQEDEKAPISGVLRSILEQQDVDAAIGKYHQLMQNEAGRYDFSENQLNSVGYFLLGRGRLDEAVKIFELNIEAFPDACNPYDSLAEAYLHKGDMARSKEFYKKALSINPEYDASIAGLNKIYVIEHYDKREFRVPMRDGKTLFTQVYSPKERSERYPFLIFRTPYKVAPYGEEQMDYRNVLGPSMLFTKSGYIFVYQDIRGKFMSEGEYVDVRPHIPDKKTPADIDESSDTYDTVEWLVNNIQNNNGKAGIYGTSYPGFYSVMGIIEGHPALVAASPRAPVADWFIGDDFHRNGAFYFLQAVNFFRTTGAPRPGLIKDWPPRLLAYPTSFLYKFFLDIGPISNVNARYFKQKSVMWNEMMEHGTYDDFWQARNPLPYLKDIKAAVLMVGGWYDAEDLYGPLKTYEAIEHDNPGIENYLVFGPWYHGSWGGTEDDVVNGIRHNAGSTAEYFRESVEFPFFEHHLKGKGEHELPEALIYETGSNTWRQYDHWPPKNVDARELYFQAGESLSFAKPTKSGDGAFDEYLSDPAKPVPYRGEIVGEWSYGFMHSDQRFASTRPDVLVYETEVLEEDITIAGPVTAELFVSTTGTDADWMVKIIDVYPGDAPDPIPNPEFVRMGDYQMLVRGEIFRGKYRNSFSKPEPFVPGEITKVSYEIDDINHTFLKGHRIMVQVQSSCFPLFDRNPQTFVDIYSATEKDFQKAVHRVHRSAEHPSHLKISVIRR